MPDFNKVILAGNLTRDPVLSYSPAQTAIADFGMAIGRKWKGLDGVQREEVCFVECRSFGKTAEAINQYMKKGRPILLEGRLRYSAWEKDGEKRSKLGVTVENFQFVGSVRAVADGPRPKVKKAVVEASTAVVSGVPAVVDCEDF